MLPTKALSESLSRFLGRFINHPDALTKDQTQKYLHALQNSFRRNLLQDREHGLGDESKEPNEPNEPPKTKSKRDPPSPSKATTRNVVKQRVNEVGPRWRSVPTEPSQDGHWPCLTDAHIASILSNPLLGPPQAKTSTSNSKPNRDPMEDFEEALGRGLMTLDIAKGCLEAERRLLAKLDSSDAHSLQLYAGHGVCDRVLRWFRSEGINFRLRCLSDQRFVELFIPFMVAEGKEKVLWTWIKFCRGSTNHCSTAEEMLRIITRAKAMGEDEFDGAYKTVIRASDLFEEEREAQLIARLWSGLILLMDTMGFQRPLPSTPLFDEYLSVADRLPEDDQATVKYCLALLHLHHPVSPSSSPAMEYFDALDISARTAMSNGRLLQLKSTDTKLRTLSLGVKTMKFLHRAGESSVAERLQRLFLSLYGIKLAQVPTKEATKETTETATEDRRKTATEDRRKTAAEDRRKTAAEDRRRHRVAFLQSDNFDYSRTGL